MVLGNPPALSHIAAWPKPPRPFTYCCGCPKPFAYDVQNTLVMMQLVRILALIVPEGVQPFLEILLLSDLPFGSAPRSSSLAVDAS